jgi:hypothetical protein
MRLLGIEKCMQTAEWEVFYPGQAWELSVLLLSVLHLPVQQNNTKEPLRIKEKIGADLCDG